MAIRVAVIGTGVMGTDHAKIIATQIPGAVLRVVCDADEGRARAVANDTGAAHVATDPLAVITDSHVDAVLIASPDATHGELSTACIKAGKPVLCEKPLAPSSEECLKVIGAEVRAGKRLVQTGYMRRFDPSYVDMKSVVRNGTVGLPVMLHCFHRNVSAPPWFTSEMAITNAAPHEFDIARFLLDTEYKSISVFQPKFAGASRPGAPVLMVCEMAAGQLVNIEVNNNAAYGYDVRGELVGEKGSVSLRNPAASETSVNLVSGLTYAKDWRPRFAEAYRLQNQAWIRSISTGVQAGASAWDGYVATLVAEAGLRSLASGKPAVIVPVERPALYN